MFNWAVTFLLIALVAAALGVGGLAGPALLVAQIVFVLALLAFVTALIGGVWQRHVSKR